MISSRILFTKSLGYFLRRRCFSNMRIVLVKVGACVLERKNPELEKLIEAVSLQFVAILTSGK